MLILEKNKHQHLFVLAGIIIYFLSILFIAINTDGTCDSGDSITHYLYARYAFENPENFFNHWAKPFFVLLTSPFAQVGFVGIKIFNCIAAAFTLLCVYKIADETEPRLAWIAPLLLAFTPGYFVHIFSGLY